VKAAIFGSTKILTVAVRSGCFYFLVHCRHIFLIKSYTAESSR
jgi:hypothetical protein